MCQEFDEVADAFVQQTRIAQRNHKRPCAACGRSIRKGEPFHWDRCLFDGRWYCTKRCGPCEVLLREIDAALPPGMYGDPELNCGESWEDVHGCAPPDNVLALAFITPAEAARALKAAEQGAQGG